MHWDTSAGSRKGFLDLSWNSSTRLSSSRPIVTQVDDIWGRFHQILRPSFMPVDPKSAKKTDCLTVFFVLLGSAFVKDAGKMLVKLTPGDNSGKKSSLMYKNSIFLIRNKLFYFQDTIWLLLSDKCEVYRKLVEMFEIASGCITETYNTNIITWFVNQNSPWKLQAELRRACLLLDSTTSGVGNSEKQNVTHISYWST